MRLQHRHVHRLVGDDALERDVVAVVGIALGLDDPQGVGHALAARRDVVDLVLVVGDRRPLGHVLVGEDERLAVLLPVAEARAVGERLPADPAHVAVAGVAQALVHGAGPDGEDPRLRLGRLLGLACGRRESGEVVGVGARAVRPLRRCVPAQPSAGLDPRGDDGGHRDEHQRQPCDRPALHPDPPPGAGLGLLVHGWGSPRPSSLGSPEPGTPAPTQVFLACRGVTQGGLACPLAESPRRRCLTLRDRCPSVLPRSPTSGETRMNFRTLALASALLLPAAALADHTYQVTGPVVSSIPTPSP